MNPLRVLVACEFSGEVRRAFRALGHDAWSCDLLPAEDGSEFHVQGDVLPIIYYGKGWDLLIAHPPCTYLANSGNKHLYLGKRKENGPDMERWRQRAAAAQFFKAFLNCKIPRIAIENPIMRDPVEAVGRGPDQIIQPFEFGHSETKATCLWLKNLPKLVPTKVMPPPYLARVHREAPSPDRWKNRSRTYPGFAAAFATQWGGIVSERVA